MASAHRTCHPNHRQNRDAVGSPGAKVQISCKMPAVCPWASLAGCCLPALPLLSDSHRGKNCSNCLLLLIYEERGKFWLNYICGRIYLGPNGSWVLCFSQLGVHYSHFLEILAAFEPGELVSSGVGSWNWIKAKEWKWEAVSNAKKGGWIWVPYSGWV